MYPPNPDSHSLSPQQPLPIPGQSDAPASYYLPSQSPQSQQQPPVTTTMDYDPTPIITRGLAPPAQQSTQLLHQASLMSQTTEVLAPDIQAMQTERELRQLAPSSPAIQLIKATIFLTIDCFKLTMACLLAVFVPQACPALDLSSQPPMCFDVTGQIPVTGQLWKQFNETTHTCSLQEQFVDLTPLNKYILVWNFFTLGVMVYHYLLTWKRENFLIEKLGLSITVSKINLKTVLPQHPHLQAQLYKFNQHVLIVSIVGILFQLVNSISSAALFFPGTQYYEGSKTITTFFTSILLSYGVCGNCALSAIAGMRHNLAFSCVEYEPVSFNIVNPDYEQAGRS